MRAESGGNRHHLLAAGLLWGVFMLGMALRLHDLGAASLWGDEFFTGVLARLDLHSILQRTAADVHPPLSYLVARFFVVLLGDSDFVLRLPSALFGSLSILLAYKLGEMLWTRKVGIIGAFLLAVAPYHIQYSRFARHPSLTIFLSLGSLMLLLKALESGSRVSWVGFAICASLNLYNSYFALMPLASEAIFGACVVAEQWRSRRRVGEESGIARRPTWLSSPAKQVSMLGFSLLLIGLAFLPWLPVMARQLLVGGIGWEGLGGDAMPGVEFSPGYFHLWLARYSAVDGIPLLLFLGLLALGLARCRPKHLSLVALWIGMPFLFAFLVTAKHSFSPKYALFVLPVYLLVIGNGIWSLAALLPRFLRRGRASGVWPLALASSLAVISGALTIASLERYSQQREADWRGAARYLRDTMLPGDIILVDGKTYGGRADAFLVEYFLSYYLDSCGMEGTPVLRVERGLWTDLQALEPGDHEVWMVFWYLNRPGPWKAMEEVTVTDFEDLSIIRLRESHGDVLHDTMSILHLLLDLLPASKAHFDVHLALAEMYQHTESYEQARQELEMANQVNPGDGPALENLSGMFTELQGLSQPEDVRIQHPLSRSLGQVIAFLGYNLSPTTVRAGGTVDITLWWEALAKMDRDYSVFIHVLGPEDRIWAAKDRLLRQLGDGGYPTSGWQVGGAVREQYRLELPPDMPAGEYTLVTGVYYWETGERLPITEESGQEVLGDAMLLQTLIVTE